MILIFLKEYFFRTDRYVLFTKDHTRRINKWLLPAYILWSCRRIGSYDAVFLNSGWFAQSIWLLYFFRIFYPKLKVYVIHHHFRYQEMSE